MRKLISWWRAQVMARRERWERGRLFVAYMLDLKNRHANGRYYRWMK